MRAAFTSISRCRIRRSLLGARCFASPPRAANGAAAAAASAAAGAAAAADSGNVPASTPSAPGKRQPAAARGGSSGVRGGRAGRGSRRLPSRPAPLPFADDGDAADDAAPQSQRQQPPGAALPGWFAATAAGSEAGSADTGASTRSGSSSTSSTTSDSSIHSAGTNASSSIGSPEGAVARELAALTPQQRAQLETYLDYMLEVNQSMNLTAVRERGEAWARHVEDSLALLPVIEAACGLSAAAGSGTSSRSSSSSIRETGSSKRNSSSRSRGSNSSNSGGFTVIDVGSGAGLPGMVLAIARPAWRVTLLDSLRKRCAFLEAAAAKAGASNVSVVWARAEEGARRPDLREQFDLAVARAVAAAPVICELTLPFVRPGGTLVAAKGAAPEAEAAAAARAVKVLAGSDAELQVVPVDSIAPEGRRTALVVAKRARTPAVYPRAPGTPARKPL